MANIQERSVSFESHKRLFNVKNCIFFLSSSLLKKCPNPDNAAMLWWRAARRHFVLQRCQAGESPVMVFRGWHRTLFVCLQRAFDSLVGIRNAVGTFGFFGMGG